MDLKPTSELLLRNVHALHGRNVLVVDSPGGEIAPVLHDHQPAADIVLWQSDYADFRHACRLAGAPPCPKPIPGHLAAGRWPIVFDAWYHKQAQPHDLSIVYLPKGRDRLRLLLSCVSAATEPDGRILLVGPKRGGIRSARQDLEAEFGHAEPLDAARHCALLAAQRPAEQPSGQTRPTDLRDFGVECSLEAAGVPLRLSSYPGVFSHGRLDDGTQMLLQTLERPLPGPVLDFGCGCGVIGTWLARRWPDTLVDMVDSDALALAAAQRTVELNGLSAGLWASDVLSDVEAGYGAIVSNPPFHSGVETETRLAERLFREAAARLRPGGILRIVANRFLRYPALLKAVFGSCRIVSEDSRYRVYEAPAAVRGP